jgi:hypothetical protein
VGVFLCHHIADVATQPHLAGREAALGIKKMTPLVNGRSGGVLQSMKPRRTAQILFLGIGAAAWWFMYRSLAPFAKWFTSDILSIPAGHLASAVEFFVYEAPKVLMLLTVVVFGVGIVRSYFTPERTRRVLAAGGKLPAMSWPLCWAW